LQWLNQSRKTLNAIEGVEACHFITEATVTMDKHIAHRRCKGINRRGITSIEIKPSKGHDISG
jgi:hypothetical protein